MIAAAISVVADIITKLYIAHNYSLYQYTELIPGILNITNVSNDGIAFGMLDNARWLFMLATGVLVFILAVVGTLSDRNMHIIRAEVPGPVVGKLVPRARQSARLLYIIYIVLTNKEKNYLCNGKNNINDIKQSC